MRSGRTNPRQDVVDGLLVAFVRFAIMALNGAIATATAGPTAAATAGPTAAI